MIIFALIRGVVKYVPILEDFLPGIEMFIKNMHLVEGITKRIKNSKFIMFFFCLFLIENKYLHEEVRNSKKNAN